MSITYNKLVRDRIPEIIEASGKNCTTEFLSYDEYLRLLDEKLETRQLSPATLARSSA